MLKPLGPSAGALASGLDMASNRGRTAAHQDPKTDFGPPWAQSRACIFATVGEFSNGTAEWSLFRLILTPSCVHMLHRVVVSWKPAGNVVADLVGLGRECLVLDKAAEGFGVAEHLAEAG